jgi:hypothetical protein
MLRLETWGRAVPPDSLCPKRPPGQHGERQRGAQDLPAAFHERSVDVDPFGQESHLNTDLKHKIIGLSFNSAQGPVAF